MNRRIKSWFALAAAAVSVAVLGVLLFWAANAMQRTAGEMTCVGNLKAIALLLHAYHEEHGAFPRPYFADSKGRPVHSWRVMLLEQIDADLFAQYDFSEPWDGPNNRKLADKMPRCYACPNCQPERTGPYTNYVVITGPGTIFPGTKDVYFEDITDPKGQTILVAEIANSDIHWMEPRDLEVATMSFQINDPAKPSISSTGCRLPGICFADGITARLKANVTPRDIKAMITIAGNEKVDMGNVVR